MLKTTLLAAALMAGSTVAAFAHVTLDTKEAAVGSTVRLALRVPHGCDGKPTNVVRIRLPEGLIAAKPMPKAGWTLETVKGAYEATYDYHGAKVSEGVKEIVWSGGSLSDEHYDEFVFRGSVAGSLAEGTTLYVPVVQECGDAAERWIEIPAEGQDGHDLKFPAPGFKLVK